MLAQLLNKAEKRENGEGAMNYKLCSHGSITTETKSIISSDEEKIAGKCGTRKHCNDCDVETYWKNNKHQGCTSGKDSIVLNGYAVTMTKIDVSQGAYFSAWGMYNYYRMQV